MSDVRILCNGACANFECPKRARFSIPQGSQVKRMFLDDEEVKLFDISDDCGQWQPFVADLSKLIPRPQLSESGAAALSRLIGGDYE